MAVISVEAKTMHRARIFFLLLLCSATSVGQEPQWTVIKHVILMQQDQSVFGTLLTPSEPGIYRLNLYFSVSGQEKGRQSYFMAHIHGTDITGSPVDNGQLFYCDSAGAFWMPPIMVALKPQEPLTYYVNRLQPPTAPCQYNLGITVEQLVQQ